MTEANASSTERNVATVTKKKRTTNGDTKSSTTPKAPRTAGAPFLSDPVAEITAADVQALEDAFNTFTSLLGASAVALTKGTMAKLPKPKKNSAAFVSEIVAICQRFNIAPETSTFEVASANQNLAATLIPATGAAANLLKTLKDTAFVAESNACAIASATYRVLVAKAKVDPNLAAALLPVREMVRPKLLTPSGTRTVKRARSAKGVAKAKGASLGSPAAPAPPTAHS